MNLVARELNILAAPTSDRASKKKALERIFSEIDTIEGDFLLKIMEAGATSLKDPIESRFLG
jgi:hypothetical protein